MFPFEENEDIEDAEYVEVPQDGQPMAAAQSVYQVVPEVNQVRPNYPANGVVNLNPVDLQTNMPAGQIELYEKRARAISIFVRIPFFAFVALHDRTPPLVRMGAAALGIWEALQLARNVAQVEQTVTDWSR